MKSHIYNDIAIMILAAIILMPGKINGQWIKVQNPLDDEIIANKYPLGFYGTKAFSKDTLIDVKFDKEVNKWYLFRTFNRWESWEILEWPMNKVGSPQFMGHTSIYDYEIVSDDTICVAYSKNLGSTWQKKKVKIKGLNTFEHIVIINENIIYAGTTKLTNTKQEIYKLDISGNEPIKKSIFTTIGEDNNDYPFSQLKTNHSVYFNVPKEGQILASVVEQYSYPNDTTTFRGLFFKYSLFSENDGTSWQGYSGTRYAGKGFTPIKKLFWDGAPNDPHSAWDEYHGLIYSAFEDSIGTVIIYADRPFNARPSHVFNPEFVKQQSGVKSFSQFGVRFDIIFTDTNRAYCIDCKKTYDSLQPLYVFDRYKGLVKIATPDLPDKRVYLEYADTEVVYIGVSSGQANNRKYELYMLKTSDITGINHDDNPKQGLVVLYPNPSDGTLRWNIADGTATITDAAGRQVLALPASAQQADVSGLAAGVYVLTVRTSAGAVSRTFVKE